MATAKTGPAKKIRIAHLAGPNATIQNTPPLVTSNKARAAHGLPLLTDVEGQPSRFDVCHEGADARVAASMARARHSSPVHPV